MTTNTDSEIAAKHAEFRAVRDALKHAEFRAVRDAFAAKLTEAFVAAGFKVTGKLPTADWASGTLYISSDKQADFDHSATFELVGTRWSRAVPSLLRLKYRTSASYRTKGIFYKKLNDELITKLVATAVANLETKIASKKAYAEAVKTQAEWKARKEAELKGLSVPPGVEVRIRMGTGSDAGTFSFKFNAEDPTLAAVKMTKEQVFKLAAVLNEIMDTQNKFVIVGEQNGKKVTFSRCFSWADESCNYTGPMLFSRADAEARCANYTEKENVRSVRIISYAEAATI